MNIRKRLIATITGCLLTANLIAQHTTGWKIQPITIKTRWAKQVSPVNSLPEYPRPQMVRSKWTNLNGLWHYTITAKSAIAPSEYNTQILVPYPIESALSGVKKALLPEQNLWYKRTITKPALRSDERVLLHFGAVDYEATVYVNGKIVGKHTGGYQNFSFDITNQLKTGKNELTVKVWDPTDQGPNPHGKQVLNPGGIMYTPSSGIWQTVWMETVPSVSIANLKITPDVDGGKLDLAIKATDGAEPEIVIYDSRSKQEISRRFASLKTTTEGYKGTIQIPNAKLWSPDDPFLYDLLVRLKKNGKVVDEVKSYFGMRKIEVKKDEKGMERIFLNNKYTYNLGTLDQGFWPDGLYTAATDEALKFDIIAAKAMGFNTIRKHIKIEPARWYYHCDKLGILVWQDMVNPGNDTKEAREQFEKENAENLAQLHNYPSITTWVLFNEGWGTYDQARLTKWMKDTDPSRMVNGHSGENYFKTSPMDPKQKWANSDMTDIHAYPPPNIPDYLPGKARVLGEFGGIAVSVENHLWDDVQAGFGYGDVVNPKTMIAKYAVMTDTLKKLEARGLSGSIYTQPFDVELEQNGIMTYDRTVIKIPVATIRKINSKVWPVTSNYAQMSEGFSAKVADTIAKDYASRLAEYRQGKKDSLFLRNLAIMADGQKDQENAAKISRDYIAGVKNPLLQANLGFIQKFTYTSKDPGFDLLLNNLDKIATVTEPKPYKRTVEGIIFKEEVKQLLGENPDWNQVDAIIKKYKGIDGELIIGLSVIDYLNAISQGQKNGTKNLVAAATLYDDRFHDGTYNAWAWLLFESTAKKEELTKALEWSKKEIDRTAKESGNYGPAIDTYANILYKLGRTEEALEWQSRAVKAAPNDRDIKASYEKMQRGIKTWQE